MSSDIVLEEGTLMKEEELTLETKTSGTGGLRDNLKSLAAGGVGGRLRGVAGAGGGVAGGRGAVAGRGGAVARGGGAGGVKLVRRRELEMQLQLF